MTKNIPKNKPYTHHLLMTPPVHFAFNHQTAATNSFQQKRISIPAVDIQRQALIPM